MEVAATPATTLLPARQLFEHGALWAESSDGTRTEVARVDVTSIESLVRSLTKIRMLMAIVVVIAATLLLGLLSGGMQRQRSHHAFHHHRPSRAALTA